jgi:hypothetical protein
MDRNDPLLFASQTVENLKEFSKEERARIFEIVRGCVCVHCGQLLSEDWPICYCEDDS